MAGGASGTASIRLNQRQKRVCFTLTGSGLGNSILGAHIHRGVAGVAGDIVIPLPTASLAPLEHGAPARGCVQNVDVALIKAIRQNPAGFYVNIHTEQFPSGAGRGQLG